MSSKTMYHVLIDGLVAVSPLVLQKTRPCNVDIFCGGEEAPQVRRPLPTCAHFEQQNYGNGAQKRWLIARHGVIGSS